MSWSRHARVAAICVAAVMAALTWAPVGWSSAQQVDTRSTGAVAEVAEVAAPPPGALVTAFATNQLIYCSLICPHIVDFVVDVPRAAVQAPGVYGAARAAGRSSDRALGTALATVTAPARSSMDGIIDNDLNLVLPRAQNALEVAVVEMMHVTDVARSGAGSAAVGAAFDTGRARILDALTAPIVPNPPQIAAPTTPAQQSALDAIDVGSAVLFQAPEIMMTGATESADVAATELARSGDIDRAREVGAQRFGEFLDAANGVIEQSR
ncbi:hypothetical protein [Gordonia mangrovi]|uniref:hypothetical protein n=1 Tax=Gordonia mangrovi TaxID=2665643 RepID=UPI0019254CF1|nr:hypothetical protein [Gordonia mangrovi]UVF80077.1 hypothetical protein NWF22_09750 [Gordonia mangrovi]